MIRTNERWKRVNHHTISMILKDKYAEGIGNRTRYVPVPNAFNYLGPEQTDHTLSPWRLRPTVSSRTNAITHFST
jgi:hypothetical protein